MRKFHIAIGVADIEQSVADYSERLGASPVVVVPGEYALWRTEQLNFSIRTVESEEAGRVRHLGWESAHAPGFTADTDCNGILWESFSAEQQAREILEIWPDAEYALAKGPA